MQRITRRDSIGRYIAQKRKAKESVPPLMDEKGELVMTGTEKDEVCSNFACLR